MADFLAMGDYGAYVWSAFGFTFTVLAGLLLQSWRAAQAKERELMELRSTLRPAREPASRPLVARRESAPVETVNG
jgi:heme exporter protein CcmD